MEAEKYKFYGQPLMPGMCKNLILEIFSGKLVTRQEIVEKVIKEHSLRGGNKANTSDIPRMFKNVLAKLVKAGLANNPSYGYWEINPDFLVDGENYEDFNVNDDTDMDTTKIIEEKDEEYEEYEADYVIGEGTGSVYLYYYPVYKQNSIKDNQTTWACKIGRSDRDPILRILAQASTALPEKPRIAAVIKTSNSQLLEQTIHNILIYRSQKINTAPGNEWYNTNPEEFLEIAKFIRNTNADLNLNE